MHVDYDTYASMSPLRKNRVLQQITPENKADLVKAHWNRFLQKNRERLTAEQIRTVEEIIERYPEKVYSEEELREIFAFEDFIWLHFGAFKNSGEIHNPLARILARNRPLGENLKELRAALYDIATLSPDELRARRPNLPTLLARYYNGLPDDFWRFVADEDVPLAASRAYMITGPRRSAVPPPPDPRY